MCNLKLESLWAHCCFSEVKYVYQPLKVISLQDAIQVCTIFFNQKSMYHMFFQTKVLLKVKY